MNLLSLGNPDPSVPYGTWILLAFLILWNIACFVLIRISNRRVLDEPVVDFDVFNHDFDFAGLPAATVASGNPLWKSVLRFVLVSFLALAVGFLVVLLFGES